MVDGKGDVAFFKHGTVEKAIKKGNYGNQTEYQYLCRDGSRKGETWHLIYTYIHTYILLLTLPKKGFSAQYN